MLNYAEVVELRLVAGRVKGAEIRDRISDEVVSVEARAVVNATGPWLDTLRRLEDPGVEPYGQLSKGVHVTLPLDEPWSAALTIPHDQVRVTFAYPWEGMLLLGTTDTPYEGDPADVAATEADIALVLGEAGVAARCGRALPGARALDVRRASRPAARRRLDRRCTPRDRVPDGQGRDADGGGRQADDVPSDRPRRSRANQGASSGSQASTAARFPFPARPIRSTSPPGSSRGWSLEPDVAAHLAHFYGSRADRVLEPRGGASRAARANPPRRARRGGAGRLRRTTRSGRRAPRTSCTAERRSPPAVSRGRRSCRGSTRFSVAPTADAIRRDRRSRITYARALSDWIEAHTPHEGDLTVATVEEPRTFIRPDGKEKVTGTGRYTADLVLAGELVAKFRYADHTHARITRIDATKARALPGVLAVVTHEDVPDVLYGGMVKDRRLFARDTVRFEGDIVAGVAATTAEIAEPGSRADRGRLRAAPCRDRLRGGARRRRHPRPSRLGGVRGRQRPSAAIATRSGTRRSSRETPMPLSRAQTSSSRDAT